MSDLSKRVVACRHWRWMPGMRAVDSDGQAARVVQRSGAAVLEDVGGAAYPMASTLPDLDDPATLGCLLALVREAWGCRTAYFTHSHGSWLVMRRDPWSLPLCEPQDTEAEALIAALEAAP